MHVEHPRTHGYKLRALINNSNLPQVDRPRVHAAIERYDEWRSRLKGPGLTGHEYLRELVRALNEYKNYIDLELIFDSQENFLYRQNGQTKLSNSILEEFLPYLFDVRLVPGFQRLEDVICGPQSSFSGLTFDSPFLPLSSGGVQLKTKDHDFSVAKVHRMTISNEPENGATFSTRFSVSHFATEIKTNLDKTMFQEAAQTANELKRAVPGARYVLLCEYLDMTPITTKLTSIDEVIVLRRTKRLASNVRSNFSTAQGRQRARQAYKNFLYDNPLHLGCFERFLHHLNECFPEEGEDDADTVLTRGYF